MNFSAARLKSLVEADPRLAKDIAAAAGFSPGSLSHWTRGKRVPGADELAALAKVFDVPLDHFFEGPITGAARKKLLPAQDAMMPQAWEQAMAEADALVERANSLRAALQRLKPAASSKRTVERARREAVAIAKDYAGSLARRSK